MSYHIEKKKGFRIVGIRTSLVEDRLHDIKAKEKCSEK